MNGFLVLMGLGFIAVAAYLLALPLGLTVTGLELIFIALTSSRVISPPSRPKE